MRIGLILVFAAIFNTRCCADLMTPADEPMPSFSQTSLNVNLSYDITSNLRFEIGGTDNSIPEFDAVIDLLHLTVNRANLEVDIVSPTIGSSYCPQVGDSFQIFEFQSINVISPFNLNLDNRLPSKGLQWDTSDLYTTGTLKVAAIPEPPAFYLLLFIGAVSAANARWIGSGNQQANRSAQQHYRRLIDWLRPKSIL